MTRGRLRGAGQALLWYGLPALTLAAVVAYLLGATVGHANPPIVPVNGVSMRPTLQAGDLIVLSGVDPKTLRKGDIVAVNVSKADRNQYDLPGQVVHRIVRIGHDSAGLFFITKGDANSGADVFRTRPDGVVGKLALDVPAAGYPLLFFRSRQGELFLIAAGLVALLYFLIGLFDERRAYVESNVLTMGTVLDQTQHLAAEVRAVSVRSEKSDEYVRSLVAAVADYGEHLRSHTEVMKNLAATTAELKHATVEMRSGLGDRGEWKPFVPVATDATAAELDRKMRETRAQLEQATLRREELRRALCADSR